MILVNFMSKYEHNKIAKIENLIWEIAEILQPNSIVDSKKIEEAKITLAKIFQE